MNEIPKINIKLEIRRNLDGITSTEIWKDWAYNDYWWVEGNASCDCNRHIFFCQAMSIDEGDEEFACSEGKYSVRISDVDTGEILIDEFSDGEADE